MSYTYTNKPHLLLLDALRGIAALIVLYYHCFECFGYEIAPDTGIFTQVCDHGYLAVDFFFLLSGFVIAYAYDDRKDMKFITFAKRRLIRLHPMVVAGAVIGLACFLLDGGTDWFGNVATPANLSLAFFMTLVMLPVFPGWGADVRGNGEIFPLNGPQWSLFFEYIGNIIYALLLKRLPTRALAGVTIVSGAVLGWHILGSASLGDGWTMADNGFVWGLLRMLFPYSLGMLLCRIFVNRDSKPMASKYVVPTFITCSVMLLILLAMPFVGDPHITWQNGTYIIVVTYMIFPAIVWAASCAGCADKSNHKALTIKTFTILGEISYPLYIIHYPLMYLFYRYHGFPNVTCTMADVWPMAVTTFCGSIVLAIIFLYAYDRPVRRWLQRTF